MSAQLPVADIEVKYVNPVKPGKKMGSIKDTNGRMYGVPPNMLSQFSPGMKCKVEYEQREGSDFRAVKRVIGNGAAPQLPAHNYRQQSNPAEAKQIAVLAIVKEWVGKIPVGDEDALIHAIHAASRAYDKTLGGVQTQRRDDMDDEVRY